MKLEKIVYQLRAILGASSSESRIDDRMLIDMINRYRAFNIKIYWDNNKALKQEWFSNLGILTPTIVNSADDTLIQYTSTVFAKLSLPKAIEIPREQTVFLRSASKHQRIEEKDMHILFKMIETEDELLKDYVAYFRLGDNIYIYPHQSKVFASCILSNPLEGITFDALTDYNDVVVSAQGTRRNLTIKDEYPICDELTTIVIIDILTKEFNMERSLIPDIKVDSADSTELMKSQI